MNTNPASASAKASPERTSASSASPRQLRFRPPPHRPNEEAMPWPARGGIENQTIICPDCGNDRLGTVDGPGVRITGQFERGGTGAVLFVAWCDECPRPIHFGFKRDLIDDNADGVRRPRIQLVRD